MWKVPPLEIRTVRKVDEEDSNLTIDEVILFPKQPPPRRKLNRAERRRLTAQHRKKIKKGFNQLKESTKKKEEDGEIQQGQREEIRTKDSEEA